MTRGRAVVLLVSLLFAVQSFAQCSFNPVLSAPYRASVLDVFLDGNDLWTATSYGVQLYDRTITPPQLVASLAVPGITRVVRASNGIAYAGSGSAIHVIRKNGRSLQLVRSIDAGATVNDLLLTTLDLYAATSNGLLQFDLLDRTNPVKTTASFLTTSPNVTSLTMIGSTLYAADSDATVEAYTLSIPNLPQRLGGITSLARSIGVETNNGRLYISDGQQTEVFSGTGVSMTKLGAAAFGATSLASLFGDAVWIAGSDRRLRAVDFTTASQAVELYRNDLAPTGGTINRIAALASDATHLYAAAGDGGLLTLDATSFKPPFPVRSYASGQTTSIVSTGDRVYAGKLTAGISEFSQTPSGGLTPARQWDDKVDLVHDAAGGFLLTSSGSSATLWSLTATTPGTTSVATFASNITSAVLLGTTTIALLDNGAIATADLSQPSPTAQTLTLSYKPALLASSGNHTIATAELLADGTTNVRYYATTDLTAPPLSTTNVPGIATALGLSGTTAAVFTFRGINVIDGTTGSTSVLAHSNETIVRKLRVDGTKIYALTDNTLDVWSATGALLRRFTLPANASALHVSPDSTIVDLATESGVTSVATTATASQPSPVAVANPNSYYKKIAANADRIYLMDAQGIDIFTTSMHFTGSLRGGGVIDLAAAPGALYTLTSNGVVTAYGIDGGQTATITINEGDDAVPLAIDAVAGAVWVSLSKGCLSGGCEKKTLVFSGALTQTSSMTGGVTDVVTNGQRAYALTDLPLEIRVINVSDPLHPATLATHAPEGARPPRSIAFAQGLVLVLGDRLIAYDATTLQKSSEPLGDYVADPTGAVTYNDQSIEVDGSCALVAGRTFSPQLYAVPALASPTTFAMPTVTKSVATTPGRFYLLTDYSVEIWSATPLPQSPRKRPVR